MASTSFSSALLLSRMQVSRLLPFNFSRILLIPVTRVFSASQFLTYNWFRTRPRSRIICSFSNEPSVVTEESWEIDVLRSEVPVVVEFHASWCGPCRMVHRLMREVLNEYVGKVKCLVVNTDDDLSLAELHGIKAVPVVLIFKNGRKMDAIVGTMPEHFYVAAIDNALRS